MKLTIISYYVSDYGYGHATRTVALMRHLAANDKYQFIIISSGGALNYMQYSLKQYKNITYREAKLDLGYILNSKH